MSKSYTSNQTGAIACLLASALWGLTVFGAAPIQSYQPPLVYSIHIIMAWILFPFYIRLERHAFIAGIFILTWAMGYLVITPSLFGTPEWYLLERGLFDFTYFLFYLIGTAHTYFGYNSWRELHVKEVGKI